MALKKIRLGELITESTDTNQNTLLTVDDVRGMSIQKIFILTKADMEGVPLKSYKLVKQDMFAYVSVTSRNGGKITLAHNTTNDTYIVSSTYTVFRIVDPTLILSDYLFMYFNRPEFDRYSRFNSWGSARETFSWEDFCDIEIDLPDLATQQKYVDIYNAMKANQKAYERGLEDLKLVCDGYIEKLRKEVESREIGEYIESVRDKNSNDAVAEVFGVSILQKFITASSSVDKSNLSAYKIVKFQDIAYVPTTHMKVYAIALSNNIEDFVVSPIYEVFRVKNKSLLIPEYLFLWLCRDETKRYAFYNSWGSARENFNFDDMCTVKIPIPPIEVQESIANIYKCYEQRKEINEQLKEKIRDICPILIKGSIDEARGN